MSHQAEQGSHWSGKQLLSQGSLQAVFISLSPLPPIPYPIIDIVQLFVVKDELGEADHVIDRVRLQREGRGDVDTACKTDPFCIKNEVA